MMRKIYDASVKRSVELEEITTKAALQKGLTPNGGPRIAARPRSNPEYLSLMRGSVPSYTAAYVPGSTLKFKDIDFDLVAIQFYKRQ